MKNFDLFGIEIPLYYNKKSKYKSQLGGILSLSVVAFGLVLCFYFGNNFLKKKNPQITTITNTISNIDINLNKEEFFFFFGFYSYSKRNYIYNESFFKLSAKIYSYGGDYINDEIILNFERCSKKNVLYFNKKIQFSLEYIYNLNIFCLDLESQKKLEIINTQDLFQSFSIFLSSCKNNSNQTCASKNEIQNILNEIDLEIGFTNNNLNILNYNNVKNHELKFLKYKIYPTETNEVQIKFNQLELITDNGFFFENKYSQIFTQFHSSKKEIHQNDGKHLLSIEILADLNVVTTTRNYDKIPKILAEVGGVLNLYILFIKICFQPFVRIILLKEIINEHYYINTFENENYFDNKYKKPNKNVLDNNNKKNKKFFNIEDNIISESKINKIKNFKTPPVSMLTNYLRKKFVKIKISFCELIKVIIFKKMKKDKDQEILHKIVNDFESILEIKNLLKKIKEIDIIKDLIFDENQKQIIDFSPIYYQDEQKKNECIKYKLDQIKQKNNKNDLDIKILNKFCNS